MEYYSAIRNNEIQPCVTTWIGIEGTMQSEMSEAEGQIPYDLTHYVVDNNDDKQTHRDRDWIGGYPRGRGEGGGQKG